MFVCGQRPLRFRNDRTRMLDIGFLFAAGRASVDADIDDGDGYTDDTRAQLAEMQEAMSLTWRILLVWGVVFALFVLAGKIASAMGAKPAPSGQEWEEF